MKLSVLFLLLFTFVSFADEPASPAFAARVHEIEGLIANKSIVSRPPDADMNLLVQCRSQELFDQSRALFTAEDLKELSANKCHDKFCIGDSSGFDATLKRAVKRSKEFQIWLGNQRDLLVSVHGKDTIPNTLVWDKFAESEEELHQRWKKQLTLAVIREALTKHPNNPLEANFKEIQEKVIDDSIQALSEQAAFWEKMTDEDKKHDLTVARLTCLDRYSRIVPKEVAEDNVNAGLGGYPITSGLQMAMLPDGLNIITTIPGSPADLSEKFLPLDKVLSVKLRGETYDLTTREGRAAYGKLKPVDHEPYQMKLKRDGKIITVDSESARSLPNSALVIEKDLKVDGKRFRFVTVPGYFAHDPNLSPTKDISTSQQVARALGDRENYDAIVLDLRGNGGGRATEGNTLAGLFLSEKLNPTSIVAHREGDTPFHTTLAASATNPYSDKPLFVLVNQQSASASEITVSALKAAKRAVIIGEPTHGKGIEQQALPLSDGSVLFQTTNANVGLNGANFHRKGLDPDLYVPYLAGTNVRTREGQAVDVPMVKGAAMDAKYTDDFYRVDDEALDLAKKWGATQQKSDAELKAYYDALEELRKNTAKETYVLNLEKARKLDERTRELKEQALKYGGADDSYNFVYSGPATIWSLELAAQYMKQAETLAKAKQKAKEVEAE